MGTSKGYECRYLCFSGEPVVKALSVHAWLDCALLSRLPGEPSGEPSRTLASESFQPKQLSTGSCHSLAKASSQGIGRGGWGMCALWSQERKTSHCAGGMGRIKLWIHRVVYRSQWTSAQKSQFFLQPSILSC